MQRGTDDSHQTGHRCVHYHLQVGYCRGLGRGLKPSFWKRRRDLPGRFYWSGAGTCSIGRILQNNSNYHHRPLCNCSHHAPRCVRLSKRERYDSIHAQVCGDRWKWSSWAARKRVVVLSPSGGCWKVGLNLMWRSRFSLDLHYPWYSCTYNS